MSEAIEAALIAGMFSVLVAIIKLMADNNKYRKTRTREREKDKQDLLIWQHDQAGRLERLEHKVDKHNGFYDKINRCELKDVEYGERLKALEEKIGASKYGY